MFVETRLATKMFVDTRMVIHLLILVFTANVQDDVFEDDESRSQISYVR
jgi:hypothetical protein